MLCRVLEPGWHWEAIWDSVLVAGGMLRGPGGFRILCLTHKTQAKPISYLPLTVPKSPRNLNPEPCSLASQVSSILFGDPIGPNLKYSIIL